MFLFQLKQEKTRSASAEQPAQKCRDGFMVEQRGWIGCDVIDKENIARRLPAEKLKEIKAFYSEFVSACVSTLKEKGIDGSDIPIAWAEISSFLWSNFTFAGTGLLSEAFEKRTFSFSLDLPLKSDYPIVSAKYKEDTEPRSG